MLDLGKELAKLRKEKGFTIKALAELVGTKPNYIGDLEHGKLAGIEVASKLARVLDVPLEVFFIKPDKQKQYNDMKATEECDKNYRRLSDSPRLEILNLSARSLNALYSANIETVGELLILSEKELSKIRGLGPASQREVKMKLIQYSPPRTDKALNIANIDGLNSLDN